MSKSKPKSGKKQANDSMKHYLYVDMDFINSYLAQSKQGLQLLSRHTNSNTDNNYEDRSSHQVKVDVNGNNKSDPGFKFDAWGASIGVGNNTKAHADVAATIEGLERGERETTFSENAFEVAMHDYAINLFIDSVEQQIQNHQSGSRYFISKEKEWNLLDFSDVVSRKLQAYIELIESDFSSFEPEALETLQTILPQAQALSEVFKVSLPTKYAIRKSNYVGHMNPECMRYSMDTMIFEFGTKQKFNVLGLKTSSARPSIGDDLLQNPQKLITSVSPYLDENFLPMATEMKNSDQVFKPIVIYMNVD